MLCVNPTICWFIHPNIGYNAPLVLNSKNTRGEVVTQQYDLITCVSVIVMYSELQMWRNVLFRILKLGWAFPIED